MTAFEDVDDFRAHVCCRRRSTGDEGGSGKDVLLQSATIAEQPSSGEEYDSAEQWLGLLASFHRQSRTHRPG
jgi:hypothetical protein